MAIEMKDIKFPPIGNDKPYVVLCNGEVFAGFDTHEEAMAARDMYAMPVRTAKRGASANTLKEWVVRKRG